MDVWFNGLGLGPALLTVLTASSQAALLALIVLTMQVSMGRWLSPRWRYALWSVVVLRLMMPVAPGSALSVFNLFLADPVPTVVAIPAVPPPVLTGVVAYTLNTSGPSSSVVEPVRVRGMDDIALAVWLAGVAVILMTIIVINVALAFRLRRRAAITDPVLLDLLESCKREMGVSRKILLYDDPKTTSPALAGVFRPSLLIPPGLLDDLPREELRFILLHELAHVKNYDIAQNWLLIVLSAVHWFNPVIWFAFARLRADRELARDAMVLSTTGTNASQAYGQTIIHTLERITRPNLHNPALAGIGDGLGQLKRRLRMIAQAPKRRPALTFIGITLLATLAVIGLTDAAEPEPLSDDTAKIVENSSPIKDQPTQVFRVDFDQIPLDEAINQVREKFDLLLFVNWKTLEAAGVDRTEPITMAVATTSSDMLVLTIFRAVSDGKGLDAPAIKRIDGVLNVSTRRDLRTPSVTRVYDIRHLLRAADPDSKPMPLVPRADGTIPERPAKKKPSREELVGQIADMVRETVGYYEEWEAHGGDLSSVSELAGNLIVNTSQANHEKIPALLVMLGEKRSVQIRFELKFLLVPERFAEETGMDLGLEQTPEGNRIAFLDDLEAGLVTQAVRKNPSAKTLAASQVLQLNGKKFSVTVASQVAYVAGYEQVEGEDGIEYEPLSEVYIEGINLEGKGTVSADRRSITLALHPTVTNVAHPLEKKLWKDSPADQELFIEVPKVTKAEKEITLSIPDQGTALIDVGTVSGPMDKNDPVEEGVERRVYMLVKPAIIIQPDNERTDSGLAPSASGHVGNIQTRLSPEAARLANSQAAEPQASKATKKDSRSDWRARFEARYRLDKGEIIRRIAPPFIPERLAYYTHEEDPYQVKAIPEGPDAMYFRWNDGLVMHAMAFGRDATIERLINYILDLYTYEYIGDKQLLSTQIPGDWVYEFGADDSAKRLALTRVIREAIGKQLQFELKPMERDVIVATGKWKWSPLADQPNSKLIHVYAEDQLDGEKNPYVISGDFDEFFRRTGWEIGVRFDNQVTAPPTRRLDWRWHVSSSQLREVTDAREHKTRLRSLLDNLTKQTGLTFTVERRVEDVWVVSEEPVE